MTHKLKMTKEMKVIGTSSEMSNLVGMFAVFVKNEKIDTWIFISGKADNAFFICQVISPLTGVPNVAKLLTLVELRDWTIIPTKELADEIIEDYARNGRFRYEPNIDHYTIRHFKNF